MTSTISTVEIRYAAITLDPGLANVAELVVGVSRELGLSVGKCGTLRSYPGSLHWHLGRSGEKGTLEVTYWPEREALWLKVARNRQGTWTSAAEAEWHALFVERIENERRARPDTAF